MPHSGRSHRGGEDGPPHYGPHGRGKEEEEEQGGRGGGLQSDTIGAEMLR